MGTIDYVAPEQIAGEEIDGRADVYSLGCVLYECLVGQPPFRRDSELAVVFAHLETEPPAPSAERPELPAALDAVIARALAKEPEQRYPSCRELARAALAVAVDEASRVLVDVASRAAAGRSDLSEVEAELAGKVIDLQLVREQARALSARPPRPAWPRRESARSRVSRASSRSMPTTSSAASGSSPSSSLVSSAPASSASSARRAAASRRSSAPASCRRSPEACCRAARAGGVCCCAPGSGRWTSFAACSYRERRILSPRHSTRCPTADASCSPSTSSRSCSRPAAPRHERAAFADALARAAADPDGRAVVVVALRADFYGRFAAYPGLAELLGANQVLVGPMQASELRRAVELPAGRVGLRVEPELADALVDDVEGEPGALPLLSTALLELWQKRQDNTLTLAAYRESGGVHGAVARLAEGTYGGVPDQRKPLVRALMLRLVAEDEGDAPVRRRAPLAELDLERNTDMADVLGTLADSRLVTVGEGSVEVAHEALLREWPRLRDWIEEDAEGRRLRRHVTQAATEWDAAGRDKGELYRGARLAAALDWSTDHALELNELERGFVSESREASEHDTKRARRTNRRLRALLAGVAVLLAAAVAGGVFASRPARGGARRGDGPSRPAPRRAGARRGGPRPLAPARPPGSRDRRLPANARLPACRAAARRRGDRDHARPGDRPSSGQSPSAPTGRRSPSSATASGWCSSTPGRSSRSASRCRTSTGESLGYSPDGRDARDRR